MKRLRMIVSAFVATTCLAACGSVESDTPSASVSKTPPAQDKVQPQVFQSPGAAEIGPFNLDYKVIGTPVVGSPVSIRLNLSSPAAGPAAVDLEYRINNVASMTFGESQPQRLRLERSANEPRLSQTVTVIPQREGRLYLNVEASYETEDGTVSTLTAIPIHVGQVSTELEEQGQLEIDEDGRSVKVLTSE